VDNAQITAALTDYPHLSQGKHKKKPSFIPESDQTLAQATERPIWRGCGEVAVSFLGDAQTPMGHCPGKLALSRGLGYATSGGPFQLQLF